MQKLQRVSTNNNKQCMMNFNRELFENSLQLDDTKRVVVTFEDNKITIEKFDKARHGHLLK